MNLNKTLVSDLDGTILDITGIRDWSDGLRDDYPEFHRLAMLAPPIRYMADQLQAHWDSGYDVILLTARSEIWRPQTMQWLYTHNIPYHKLIMRGRDDERSDAEVKLEKVQELLPHHNIVVAFEDKPDIVQIWDYLGIPCWFVSPQPEEEGWNWASFESKSPLR